MIVTKSEFVEYGYWRWVPQWVDQIDVKIFNFISSILPQSLIGNIKYLTESKAVLLGLCATVILLSFVKRKSWRFQFIYSLLIVLLMDFCISEFLKPSFGRVKPYQNLGSVPLNWIAYSFPSAHAANIGVVWGVLRRYKTAGRIFGVLALLIASSRVIIGVHYPLDVLGGLTLGFCIGILFDSIYQRASKKFFRLRQNKRSSVYSDE